MTALDNVALSESTNSQFLTGSLKVRLKFLMFVLAAAVLIPRAEFGADEGRLPIAVGAKMSTLGIGIEGTTRLWKAGNARVSGNFFDYSRNFGHDGVDYAAKLSLRSFQIIYDQYLFKGLHVSPGLLAYNGNKLDGGASVNAGQSFSLGGTQYFSSQTNPITGTAAMTFKKTVPMVLLGVGNPLPRSGRRFGFNIDAGLIFQSSPMTSLALAGTACSISRSAGCVNAGTDPAVQANVINEQNKINNDTKVFKYYPVISAGVSWRIK
jgi:hypothetical protein